MSLNDLVPSSGFDDTVLHGYTLSLFCLDYCNNNSYMLLGFREIPVIDPDGSINVYGYTQPSAEIFRLFLEYKKEDRFSHPIKYFKCELLTPPTIVSGEAIDFFLHQRERAFGWLEANGQLILRFADPYHRILVRNFLGLGDFGRLNFDINRDLGPIWIIRDLILDFSHPSFDQYLEHSIFGVRGWIQLFWCLSDTGVDKIQTSPNFENMHINIGYESHFGREGNMESLNRNMVNVSIIISIFAVTSFLIYYNL